MSTAELTADVPAESHAFLTARLIFVLIAAVCVALLGFGLYLQYAKDLAPCPLCMLQRVCFIAVALASAGAALHGPRGVLARVYAGVVAIVAAAGAGLAGRQVWLQHLPEDRVPECGPGLEFMLEIYPFFEVIARTLRGTGECAEVVWRFLGLSIPEWSLICFTGIVLACIGSLFLPPRKLAAG